MNVSDQFCAIDFLMTSRGSTSAPNFVEFGLLTFGFLLTLRVEFDGMFPLLSYWVWKSFGFFDFRHPVLERTCCLVPSCH